MLVWVDLLVEVTHFLYLVKLNDFLTLEQLIDLLVECFLVLNLKHALSHLFEAGERQAYILGLGLGQEGLLQLIKSEWIDTFMGHESGEVRVALDHGLVHRCQHAILIMIDALRHEVAIPLFSTLNLNRRCLLVGVEDLVNYLGDAFSIELWLLLLAFDHFDATFFFCHVSLEVVGEVTPPPIVIRLSLRIELRLRIRHTLLMALPG